MNCPHCGMAIPAKNGNGKGNGKGAEAKYREDVRKAEAAIAVLERWQPDAIDLIPDGATYHTTVHRVIDGRESFQRVAQSMTAEVREANLNAIRDGIIAEAQRLREAVANPAQLCAIYRRSDKKTPVAYGMEAAQ